MKPLKLKLALTFLSALVLPGIAHAADKPNVILIMADDLGYNDLSCYGSEVIRTPVLDKMASEGMRLTSFYAGATICTPSRMALLTGAYPPRLGWRGGVVGYGVKTNNGLAPEALTMGEVLKSAGYATALIGKWHLGDAESMQPMDQGFDVAYYINKSNNQTKKLFSGSKLIEDPFKNPLLTQQFTTESIKFIEANRDRPFFLYLPFTAPHFPAQAHPDWKGKSKLGAYGDVVEEMDSRIGEILKTLKDQKLYKKTIVVFISDNGVEPGQKKWARSNPYRGLKWSALEGGNRVPCIVRWPAVVPAGKVNDDIVAAIDLLPTLAHVCGIGLGKQTKGNPKIDGVNVWDTIAGKSDGKHARNELLIWHGWGVLQAIRVGDWKLYVDKIKEIPASSKGLVLINLANDPAEQTNLADKHPDRVAAMKGLATKRLTEIEQNAMKLGGPPLKKQNKKRAMWLQ